MNPTYNNYQTAELSLEEPVFYGDFWQRFAASFIDGLILMVPIIILKFTYPLAGTLLNIFAPWLYAALMESGEGQATVGKRAMGLRVTDVDGGRISFAQATGRHFGKWISAIILLIGYLMMLWNDRKQTLHDQMAGCVVVKA